jgi:hypothetical protein
VATGHFVTFSIIFKAHTHKEKKKLFDEVTKQALALKPAGLEKKKSEAFC